MLNKLVRDGKVAVIVQPNYGCGWSTEVYHVTAHWIMAMDRDLVELVLDGDLDGAKALVLEKVKDYYPEEHMDLSYVKELKVLWVPEGTLFQIDAHEGRESIHTFTPKLWHVA